MDAKYSTDNKRKLITQISIIRFRKQPTNTSTIANYIVSQIVHLFICEITLNNLPILKF